MEAVLFARNCTKAMRYIKRRRVDIPPLLKSSPVQRFRNDTATYLASAEQDRRPPNIPADVLTNRELIEAVSIVFRGKCAYCECTVGPGGANTIDQFRPRAGAEQPDGRVDFRRYCWLALEWNNLYLACAACNRAKRDRFPVRYPGPIGAPLSELRKFEQAELLDPTFDNPGRHFVVNKEGWLLATSKRGLSTITLLNLNRPQLLKDRRHVIDILSSLIEINRLHDDLADSLKNVMKLLDDSTQFSGIARLALRQMLPEGYRDQKWIRTGLSEQKLQKLLSEINDYPALYSPPLYSPTEAKQTRERHYIRKIVIKNFRRIEELVLEFPEQGGRTSKVAGSLVVLGENAVGKTCALQAAALGTMGPDRAMEAGMSPDWCLRDGAESGSVEVHFWDTQLTNLIEYERGTQVFGGHESVDVVVLGYGAYRLPSRGPLDESSHAFHYRVNTLFDERKLVGGAYGLHHHFRNPAGSIDDERVHDATRTLNALLVNEAAAKVLNGTRLVIEEEGKVHPIERLSSGYKSVVSMASDIMDVMYTIWNGTTSGQAFILIDEIDAHLHPTWRLRVVEAFRSTFPLSQFLITTHDPLVLRGLEDQEVRILGKSGSELTMSDEAPVPNIAGLTVDQLLTSRLFGLDTTLDVGLADRIAHYYSLLARSRRTDEEEQDLLTLRSELERQQPMGNTRRERLLYAIIDRRLAIQKDLGTDTWDAQAVEELLSEFEEAENEVFEK